MSELQPGDVIRDKYRIERVIGRGGMGSVLSAWHIDLERRVAIKLLLPALRESRDLVDRFLREARAASRLDGEHIARILDVDRLADGTPFIVMEYLEGTDLSHVRRSQSPAGIRDAVGYVIQACEALQQAHERGIVHRDIKPANLFLTRTSSGAPTIKILDFGISKMSAASDSNMTKTSVVMGSAEYMSPEQMLSARDVDGRTDIWALGAVLFELLTASPPFPGETLPQVCALVLAKPPPRPKSLRPDLPDALDQTILTCLEKDRERRFATAADLASALRASLSSTNVGIGPVSLPGAVAAAPIALPILLPPLEAQSEDPKTVALPIEQLSAPPARPTTGQGTSISTPPPRLESQPPRPVELSRPPSIAFAPSPMTAALADSHAPAAFPTATPHSRDYQPPKSRMSRGALAIAGVLVVSAIGAAVGLVVTNHGAPRGAADSTQGSTQASTRIAVNAPSALVLDSARAPAATTPSSAAADVPAVVPPTATSPTDSASAIAIESIPDRAPPSMPPQSFAKGGPANPSRPSSKPLPAQSASTPSKPVTPSARPVTPSGID